MMICSQFAAWRREGKIQGELPKLDFPTTKSFLISFYIFMVNTFRGESAGKGMWGNEIDRPAIFWGLLCVCV